MEETGLKSFRINKTLKQKYKEHLLCSCLKSFRINKTLKLSNTGYSNLNSLKSFRINKTLKPQIRFSPSRYLLAIEGC